MATSVIEKIAKLRRLATSTNVNEAAAAAAAADRLMQEHGIAEAQLEAAGEAPKENPVEDSSPLAFWQGKHTPSWQVQLGARLVSHYGCSCYLGRATREINPGQWARGATLCIIGRPSDIASVRYMYAWLTVEISRLASLNAGNGRAIIARRARTPSKGCAKSAAKPTRRRTKPKRNSKHASQRSVATSSARSTNESKPSATNYARVCPK